MIQTYRTFRHRRAAALKDQRGRPSLAKGSRPKLLAGKGKERSELVFPCISNPPSFGNSGADPSKGFFEAFERNPSGLVCGSSVSYSGHF
jgi:hypothetical protein